MRVIALKRGEKAPLGVDCVSIERTDTGEFLVSGALSVDRRTVAIDVPADRFTTESTALNAAIAWAHNGGCMMLYLERSTETAQPNLGDCPARRHLR